MGSSFERFGVDVADISAALVDHEQFAGRRGDETFEDGRARRRSGNNGFARFVLSLAALLDNRAE